MIVGVDVVTAKVSTPVLHRVGADCPDAEDRLVDHRARQERKASEVALDVHEIRKRAVPDEVEASRTTGW